MTDPDIRNMLCPKCGEFQPKAEICIECGVVIAKVKSKDTGKAQAKDAAAQVTEELAPFGSESTSIDGPRQKFVMPMLVVGAILVAIALAMLANKLTGGSLNHGAMRHWGWFLIPVIGMVGGGCVAQALEWKTNNS